MQDKEILKKLKEEEILKSKIRKPYNPYTIDDFLDKHKWCRTSKYNGCWITLILFDGTYPARSIRDIQ